MSDGRIKEFQYEDCWNEHYHVCTECKLFPLAMQLFMEELEEVRKSGIEKKEFELMMHQYDTSKSNVERWRQHIVRSVCQQKAWKHAMDVRQLSHWYNYA